MFRKNGTNLTEMLRSDGFKVKAEMMKHLYLLALFRKNGLDAEYSLQMTEDAADEMLLFKQFLENIVIKPIGSFAFPYGACARDTVAKAKKTNYKQLLAMDFRFKGDHKDAAMRERFTVRSVHSAANPMHAKIAGSYER